jgi:hypothetical protein
VRVVAVAAKGAAAVAAAAAVEEEEEEEGEEHTGMAVAARTGPSSNARVGLNSAPIRGAAGVNRRAVIVRTWTMAVGTLAGDRVQRRRTRKRRRLQESMGSRMMRMMRMRMRMRTIARSLSDSEAWLVWR